MSEKRSWDVQRKASAPVKASPPPQRPQGAARAVKPVEPVRKNAAPKPVQRRAAPVPVSGTLRERRKKKRRVMRYVLLFILLCIAAGSLYALWMPALRIQNVTAQGPDADPVAQIARVNLVGSYWHVIPRNSIFFFPAQKIRDAVLDAQPDISAVSISRTTFYSIHVTTTPRAAAFLWCGTTIDTAYADGSCFDADIEGLIFKQDVEGVMTTSSTTASSTSRASAHVNGQVRVFSALDREVSDGQSPIRAHILSSALIPDALRFVDAVRQLNAPVSALAIRGDEADLWLNGPTRITYVLGREKEAAELAASTLPGLSLTNGSIKYVDLRFPGKAYVMKYGEGK